MTEDFIIKLVMLFCFFLNTTVFINIMILMPFLTKRMEKKKLEKYKKINDDTFSSDC